VLGILTALIVAGLAAGSSLQTIVRNRMRRIWYQIPATRPRPPVPAARPLYPQPAGIGALNKGLEWFRLRPAYQTFFAGLTGHVLPGLFLVLVLYLAYSLVSRFVFSAADASGSVCAASAQVTPVAGEHPPIQFDTKEQCGRTGLQLQKGGTYRIRFEILPGSHWSDASLPAGPNGLYSETTPWWMGAFVPVRRRVSQPWFKPMARLGSVGADDYPLDPVPSIPEVAQPATGHMVTFESEIVARSTGELFLYVNDVVPLGLTSMLYGNNKGSARVEVRQVVRRP
jgi:hypothetical protein